MRAGRHLMINQSRDFSAEQIVHFQADMRLFRQGVSYRRRRVEWIGVVLAQAECEREIFGFRNTDRLINGSVTDVVIPRAVVIESNCP